ncbi:MAG TPA: hypothetical protein VI248_25330 [Kineosporiaceae bacterium]
MNALAAGAVIALLVVGYPLYQLVTAGSLDTTSALLRGGVVAVGCALGIAGIVRLALSWETDSRRSRQHQLNTLFTDMEGAVADGVLKADGSAKTEQHSSDPAQ